MKYDLSCPTKHIIQIFQRSKKIKMQTLGIACQCCGALFELAILPSCQVCSGISFPNFNSNGYMHDREGPSFKE